MPKRNAPERGIERGGKRKAASDTRSAITGKFVPKAKAKTDPATTVTTRRKVKAIGALAWALQDRDGGYLYLRSICATRKLVIERRAEYAFPDQLRVVRVRVEVVE